MARSVSAEEAAQLRSLGYLGGAGATKTTFTAADDPKNLVALDNKMHEVVEAYEKHDLARALKLANEIVAARPDMSAGRELLAFVLQQQERIGEAIENLRAAMKTAQRDEEIRVQLGLLLTETGKTDQAVQILAPLAVLTLALLPRIKGGWIGLMYAMGVKDTDAHLHTADFAD